MGATASVFPEVDALPATEPEVAIEKWYCKRRRCQRRFDVGGHVVRTLGRMGVERVILLHESIEPILEVVSRGGIGIFLNRQAGGRVPDHDGAQTVRGTVPADDRPDLVRDLEKSLSGRRDGDSLDHRVSFSREEVVINRICSHRTKESTVDFEVSGRGICFRSWKIVFQRVRPGRTIKRRAEPSMAVCQLAGPV